MRRSLTCRYLTLTMTAVMPGSNPLVAVAFISRLSGLAEAEEVERRTTHRAAEGVAEEQWRVAFMMRAHCLQLSLSLSATGVMELPLEVRQARQELLVEQVRRQAATLLYPLLVVGAEVKELQMTVLAEVAEALVQWEAQLAITQEQTLEAQPSKVQRRATH